MSSKLFNPNWKAINAAINGTKEDRQGLWKELKLLEKKIKDKSDEYYKALAEKEKSDKIAALKKLPVGGSVYYHYRRFEKIRYGTAGVKVKDGRKRMVVNFEGLGQWTIEYGHLAQQPPTEEEMQNYKLSVKVTKLFKESVEANNKSGL